MGKKKQWHRRICKMARLPFDLRSEINVKLRDGWRLTTIVDWLFGQRVDRDVPDLNLKAGEPCSLAWTRTSTDEATARTTCRFALSRWLSSGYVDWLREEAETDKRVRLVEHVEKLSQAASQKGEPDSSVGGTLIIRSLLMEAIQEVCTGDNDPAEIARLANAWARMNQTGTEVEKLKLRSQEVIEVGLQALYDEMKDNPDAIAQFQKLREIMKRPAKRTS